LISWKFYPLNLKIPESLRDVVHVFEKHEPKISSDKHTLVSNEVLSEITPNLQTLNYRVELSKKNVDKIKVPVTYKEQGEIDLAFDADAYHASDKIVLEIEAGRAVANYQFLKDLFQACMMADVEYFCIAVRKVYRKNEDYKKVVSFFDALYVSDRIKLPLKGILVIGY
jgi:hypothetical protein